jgi:glycosyltransferase involved in cell wall biosynthesis
MAFKTSNVLIADNRALQSFLYQRYGRQTELIAYGGDHVNTEPEDEPVQAELPPRFALALCRIEPENNVKLILETFSKDSQIPLVFIGNWNNSDYSISLFNEYTDVEGIHLLQPIYDQEVLGRIRKAALLYVHGHSAGGTNPSLVEAMHYGLPAVAWDCEFNRCTTNGLAFFFNDPKSLRAAVDRALGEEGKSSGEQLLELAKQLYTWKTIGGTYFDLFLRTYGQGG